MWSPTHVQVTVLRARGLLTKGKNGRNDAFVTIALGKEKYQTSVKEKSLQDVEWHEECELPIPKHGNIAEIVLTALHRNFIGADAFLGVVTIPLADLDVYESPRNKWYQLTNKAGKQNDKDRGELEVRISFQVKAGSVTELGKKKQRSSLGQLSHMAQSVGGSLLSVGSLEKRKGIMELTGSLVRKSKKTEKQLSRQSHRTSIPMSSQIIANADPGIISEGESVDDFKFDELSRKSSASSFGTSHHVIGSSESLASRKTGSQLYSSSQSLDRRDALDLKERNFRKNQIEEDEVDELEDRSSPIPSVKVMPPEKGKPRESSLLVRKIQQFRRESRLFASSSPDQEHSVPEERVIDGSENSTVPPEVLQQYVGKSKEDLVEIICNLQISLEHQTKKVKDLEEYLDNLLARVMESSPRILQTPYMTTKVLTKIKIQCDESAA